MAGVCSCGNKEAVAPEAAPAAEDQPAATINIRYIDADSVIGSYTLAQQLMGEQQRELNKLQQWHENKQRELQGLANTISQKQQNNVYLSQASMQEDVNNLQKKSEEAERYFGTQQQRLAIAGEQMQRRLNDSINTLSRITTPYTATMQSFFARPVFISNPNSISRPRLSRVSTPALLPLSPLLQNKPNIIEHIRSRGRIAGRGYAVCTDTQTYGRLNLLFV